MSSIEIPVDVSDEFIIDIIDGAEEQGIGYWAEQSVHDTNARTLTFIETEEGEEHHLSYDDITNAIEQLINKKVSVSSSIREAITLDVIDKDGCRMDADAYDVIIQVACFGEITYG